MTDKKEYRTTIRLSSDLYNAVKKEQKTGWELSVFVRQQLEKYFTGKPDFIKGQLDTLNTEVGTLIQYRNALTEKYQKSIEVDKQRKERLGSTLPEVNLYRTITPPKTILKKEGKK